MTAIKQIRILLIFMLIVIFAQTTFIASTTFSSEPSNCEAKEELFWKWDEVRSEIDVLSFREKLAISKYLSDAHSDACYD